MWVRRASIVGAASRSRGRARRSISLYSDRERLHPDQEDLIQKAVGWVLREAGKADMDRLERYLRANGPPIPRTTLRYAIETVSSCQARAIAASDPQASADGIGSRSPRRHEDTNHRATNPKSRIPNHDDGQ